jgi:uncharacterized protein (TIGR02117 family)
LGRGFSDEMNRFVIIPLLLLGLSCAESSKILPLLNDDANIVSIYVINHGKHSGLGIRRADIPYPLVPESEDFADSDYLEFGWGDFDYYQTDDPGLWLTLKASFWSSASVLHVVGVKGSINDSFAGFEIIRLKFAPNNLAGLINYIHQSFNRKGARKAKSLRPGYGPDSLFYPAHGKFSVYNNCNGWVARALEAAGYSAGKYKPITSDQLMDRIRQLQSSDL